MVLLLMALLIPSVPVRSVRCICQAPNETSVLLEVTVSLEGCMEEGEVACMRVPNIMCASYVL